MYQTGISMRRVERLGREKAGLLCTIYHLYLLNLASCVYINYEKFLNVLKLFKDTPFEILIKFL